MELSEVLTVAQRLKKKNLMKRMKARIKIARKRALKRRANTDRLKKRARRSAINKVKKKFAGGKALNKLSMADKSRLEKIVARKKKAIDRISKKEMRVARKRDRNRMVKKEEMEWFVENYVENVDLSEMAYLHDVDQKLLETVYEDIRKEIDDEDMAMELTQFIVLETIAEEKELEDL